MVALNSRGVYEPVKQAEEGELDLGIDGDPEPVNGDHPSPKPTPPKKPRSRLVKALIFGAFLLVLFALWRYIFPARVEGLEVDWDDFHPHANQYFSPGKIWDHNDEVSAKLERCASLGMLRNTSLPLPRLSENEEQDLIAQGCGTNETTVIVLADEWFTGAYEARSTTGETIYAQSVISTLNAYNYSYMFASQGWANNDLVKIMDIWERHRWNVRLVIGERDQVKACWEDRGRKCLRTRDFPEGIDPWRLTSFWYWDDNANPLGGQWTLSPSPFNQNFYLGYSIEPTCRRLPYIPHSHRFRKPQAYLLAKGGRYLEPGPGFSWDLPFIASLQKSLGISVVAGFQDDDGMGALFKKMGMKDVGRLSKIRFYEMLGMSFVMIGVGRPRISPSPWDALCMGTPFINPIVVWDENDPSNRSSWLAQHWRMIDIDPPYVYHVHAHDLPALEAAVEAARDQPIESFIPERMTFAHVCERTAELIERDWRGLAADVLEERTRTGDGILFDMF